MVQSISTPAGRADSDVRADSRLSGRDRFARHIEAGAPRCRFCGARVAHTFADLGSTPLANSFLRGEQLTYPEPCYPLHARVCERCLLVQLEEVQRPAAIFDEYAYFSSYSETWLHHCGKYAREMAARFNLGGQSLVVELASNDGYLLQYFQQLRVSVLGVEPAQNVARAALEKGIPTVSKYFGCSTALELASAGNNADLIVANNVLAHVPDVNDFVAGMKILLKRGGVITAEFPHLLRLIEENQFDTIYHEHFSYFSFCVAEKILNTHGLAVFDVQEIATHGGSLRLFMCHAGEGVNAVTAAVQRLRERETSAGLLSVDAYSSFAARVEAAKSALLECLRNLKQAGKRVAAYGAPAKGNTLLNYCGIGKEFLDYTVDANPYKQGRFLPGTRVPIYHPDMIRKTEPDYVLILPWNLRDEILGQLAYIRRWGGRFIIPIPRVEIVN